MVIGRIKVFFFVVLDFVVVLVFSGWVSKGGCCLR